MITIVPRGMAGGFTMSLPTDDTSYRTRKEMFENIVTLLGGRIAESLILDDISTGASNDLERATAIAKAMVTRYGFSESIGPIVYGTDPNEVFLGRDIAQNRNFSEETASRIDREIRRVIEEAYNQCEEILKAHTDKLHTVSDVLMEYDKIDGETFKKLMEQDAAPSRPAEQTVTETEITVEENME